MSDGSQSQPHPLKRARLHRKWTQVHLAKCSGVSARTIGTIETQISGYRPRRDVCRRLAIALGYHNNGRWRDLFPEWWGVEWMENRKAS